MAGRYLLIEFEDNGEAYEQVKEVVKVYDEAQIIGLFARPEDFCTCGTWVTTEAVAAPHIRLETTGHLICAACAKPWPTMSWLRNQLKPESLKPSVTLMSDKRYGRVEPLGFYCIALNLNATPTRQFRKD